MNKNGLRLIAEDEEDLAVISAHLQDAVMRIGDIVYLPKSRRFAAFMNRYCWEGCPEGSVGERTHSGLHFNNVLKVQAVNVRQDDPEAVAELLALKFEPKGEGAGQVDLLLAGGGLHPARDRGDRGDVARHFRTLAGARTSCAFARRQVIFNHVPGSLGRISQRFVGH